MRHLSKISQWNLGRDRRWHKLEHKIVLWGCAWNWNVQCHRVCSHIASLLKLLSFLRQLSHTSRTIFFFLFFKAFTFLVLWRERSRTKDKAFMFVKKKKKERKGVLAEGQLDGGDVSKRLKVCSPWVPGYLSLSSHMLRFCFPRSDTPLIYKAVPSWFVRVEHMVDQLLRNNDLCYWWAGGRVSSQGPVSWAHTSPRL